MNKYTCVLIVFFKEKIKNCSFSSFRWVGLMLGLIFCSQVIVAQTDFVVERANKMADYVAEKMALSEEQSAHLNLAIVTKIKYQQSSIKGENLSEAEKKMVYTKAKKSFYSILDRRFSKIDVTTIQKYMAEFNEKYNKKKQS